MSQEETKRETDLQADLPPEQYYKAEVVEVLDERTEQIFEGQFEEIQEVQLKILDGEKAGELIETIHGGVVSLNENNKVDAGDTVVIVEVSHFDGTTHYFINDHYRIQPLVNVFVFFAFLAILFARLKGIGSLIGLAFSILVLALFIVPRILAGHDPLFTTIIGAGIIGVISLYLAHGINKRTSVAILSTLATLSITLLLSQVIVGFTHLFGTGSENCITYPTLRKKYDYIIHPDSWKKCTIDLVDNMYGSDHKMLILHARHEHKN